MPHCSQYSVWDMQRVALSLDDDLLAEVDALIQIRGYQNRSEAVRDLVRAGLQDASPAPAGRVSRRCFILTIMKSANCRAG